MKRSLVCIICPRGCSLCVEGSGNDLKVSGNSCAKGARYAVDECTHPVRTVTSIVRVSNREDTMVSVKTSVPIPKEHIFDAMEIIRDLTAEAPVHIGDILCPAVFGADVIATKDIF